MDFNKKNTINDFTMHLIISKWHRIQKSRQKRKTLRQRGRNERRNCQRKCSHLIQITRVFAFYVSLSNLENVLQRNVRTNKARECISRVSGGIHLEKLAPHQW